MSSHLKVKMSCTSVCTESASLWSECKRWYDERKSDCSVIQATCKNCKPHLGYMFFHDIIVHLYTHYWFKTSHSFFSRPKTHHRDMIKFISHICDGVWVWTHTPVLFEYCLQHKSDSPKDYLMPVCLKWESKKNMDQIKNSLFSNLNFYRT